VNDENYLGGCVVDIGHQHRFWAIKAWMGLTHFVAEVASEMALHAGLRPTT
jgi:hypothetical protein